MEVTWTENNNVLLVVMAIMSVTFTVLVDGCCSDNSVPVGVALTVLCARSLQRQCWPDGMKTVLFGGCYCDIAVLFGVTWTRLADRCYYESW